MDYLGELMPKDQRATVLSVESQLKAFFLFLMAPIFGWIADYSISLLFLFIALMIFILNLFFFRKPDELEKISNKIVDKNEVK